MTARERFEHWQIVRRGLVEALEMLTDDQLSFVPREGLWSLGTVARHIANAEEGWFRRALTRELPHWPDQFTAEAYPTVASVVALLDTVHARTLSFLERTCVEDLDLTVRLAGGEELTVGEIVWHVLEHEIHHRGEIYLMLGLVGLEAPDV